MATNTRTLTDFGERYFATAQLGDARRSRRLMKAANRISRHPGGSLPDKFQSPSELKALYRLCDCEEVTHDSVLAPAKEHVSRRIEAHRGTVLVLHDTTELDYTSNASLADDLGTIGDGRGRGYICHNSLAVDPESRAVLGLTGQILHHRASVPENESKTARRQRSDRESRLWLRGTEQLAGEHRFVDVADRGADSCEFLEHELHSGRRFVVRSAHNRITLAGHGQAHQRRRLHAYSRTLPALGTKKMKVAHGVDRNARTAHLRLSAAPVRIVPPRQKKGEHGEDPLPLWVVRVWESNPPKGEAPLEWFLLTNEPVENRTDALRVVRWYECRWIIEEFHKAMKTGCKVEELQFTAVERLEPMIALLSVVAVALLNLRDLSRQPKARTQKAAEILSPEYINVLSGWRYKQLRSDLTIYDFFYALARLGGHQNRRHDHPPGWLVLWRGWTKLQSMVDGAIAIRRKKCG